MSARPTTTLAAVPAAAPAGPRAEPAQDDGLPARILAASQDPVFSEDLAGAVTSWNAAAARVYGRTAEDVLGRTVDAVLPEETARGLRAVRDSVVTGDRVERFDSWVLQPDGRHAVVAMTVTPLRDTDGAAVGLAVSVQDVTDRVRLVAELEDVHRTQEAENLALARSNRDLEQFAFVASHDLSEPLRAMTGFVQLLEKRYSDALDERGLGYITHVVEGAARMRTLIEDLLEFSRYLVEPTSSVVDTTEVARQVVADLGVVGVEIAQLPPVCADAMSVHAVLRNLVANAVKFHRPGAAARVQVTGRTVDGHVLLCVDDDGIGIEPDYRLRVFGMFARLHVREAYAGTGIGLAIVQQVAERGGGTAWVEESPLGGCRFCVTLPGVPGSGAA